MTSIPTSAEIERALKAARRVLIMSEKEASIRWIMYHLGTDRKSIGLCRT